MTFSARNRPPESDGNDREAPSCLPVDLDWLEACRKQFLARYFDEVGPDDYEFCNQAYGDEP
jgi:hypothetical protein